MVPSIISSPISSSSSADLLRYQLHLGELHPLLNLRGPRGLSYSNQACCLIPSFTLQELQDVEIQCLFSQPDSQQVTRHMRLLLSWGWTRQRLHG